ncbi:3572_t:CDS:1 [Dentiscutata erythropus]|uniref:3572_t:CDS:1 n=1 Tax=Dentiscutata erythropus TaxID=1348616 RepID=A0A9N9HQY3_9GLOM|nr:3572_t:CDS:1 [Dentiscutata erythropus]
MSIPESFPVECMREIISYIKHDFNSLHSCLTVNKKFGEIAIEIFWRNLWTSRGHNGFREGAYSFWAAVLRTLISSLPSESKDFLNNNGVTIHRLSHGKKLIYDYPSYCKTMDCLAISNMIEQVISVTHQNDRPRRLEYIQHLLQQEICKLLIDRSISIPILKFDLLPVAYFPGADKCFEKLSELHCHTATPDLLYYALAQICKHIQNIIIDFYEADNLGLSGLIDVQQNLKRLECRIDELAVTQRFPAIIDVIKSNAISFVHLELLHFTCIPPSIISLMQNLKILKIKILPDDVPRNNIWEELASVRLPKLEVLHISLHSLRLETLNPLIANNYGNLSTLIIDFSPISNQSFFFNETVAQFCPNLRIFATWFLNNEFDVLEGILTKCQHLEELFLQAFDDKNLNLKIHRLFKLLEITTPKHFSKLGLLGNWCDPSDALKSCFESWKRKSNHVSLVFSRNVCIGSEHMDLILQYKNDGVIRRYNVVTDPVRHEFGY